MSLIHPSMAPPRMEEEEELEEISVVEKQKDNLYCAKIRRDVDGSIFEGFVEDIEIGKQSRERLYLVRYSDGDLEHMTADQVKLYMVPADSATSVQSPAVSNVDGGADVDIELEETTPVRKKKGRPAAAEPLAKKPAAVAAPAVATEKSQARAKSEAKATPKAPPKTSTPKPSPKPSPKVKSKANAKANTKANARAKAKAKAKPKAKSKGRK